MIVKQVKCVPNKGKDGLYRVVIDTHFHGGSGHDLVRHAEEATGVKWELLGCFMDTCCIATDYRTGSFHIGIDWRSDRY